MTILRRFSVNGRVAMVSGASSGLGAAFARHLAEAGADVALGARRVKGLQATASSVEALGRRALVVETDVTDPTACDRFASEAVRHFGRLDILVNNAGVATAYPASKETPDQFMRVIDVNLNGAYWLARACSRVMDRGSTIVNVGSVLGYRNAGLPQAAYSSSKAALIALTRDLASQWTGRRGIRVNALVPGFFASEMTAQYDSDYLAMQVARTPMQRLGESAELGAALLFLASDASSYMTGSSVVVDGGYLAV